MSAPDYEQMVEDYYRSFLRPGDVCIDVGAHVGRHTLPMAVCVAPSGKVHAFEPLPTIADELRAKLAAAAPMSSIVELGVCALSDVSGVSDFIFVQNNPGYSGLLPRHYDSPEVTTTIRVDIRRLDDMLDTLPRIRYVKIDCEGGELRVLRGARGLLRRDWPIATFECGDASLESYDYNSADLFDFWNDLGYSIQSITGKQLDKKGFVTACAEQQFWDYIALPPRP